MKKYGLDFISDEDLFNHVKKTIQLYRFDSISLESFTKNTLDPIKLTFDQKVYKKNIEVALKEEIFRQIDKSNSNQIGYFHQNIFKYMKNGWVCPTSGFDVINSTKQIYAEIKNKHNTMNSSSSQKIYLKMQKELLESSKATCYLVEVIASRSQDTPWEITLDGKKFKNENIRRISMDRFYELVTHDKDAFCKLTQLLPSVIDDVIKSKEYIPFLSGEKKLIKILKKHGDNLLQEVYKTSFSTYEGFENFRLK